MSDMRIVDYEDLMDNPMVLRAFEHRVDLKSEFKMELFKLWRDHGKGAVEVELENNNLGAGVLGEHFAECLIESFRNGGFPKPQQIEKEAFRKYIDENPVFRSGFFEYSSRGVVLKPDFRAAIMKKFPDMTVREIITEAGVDPKNLGNDRIKSIKKDVARHLGKTGTVKPRHTIQPDEQGAVSFEKIGDSLEEAVIWHPYIRGIHNETAVMSRGFYNEASVLMPLDVEELLKIYEVDPAWTDIVCRTKMKIKLERWVRRREEEVVSCQMTVRIQKRREKIMEEKIEKNFADLREIYKEVHKRGVTYRVCEWISELPYDQTGFYTKKRIAELMGISRSMYYKCAADPDYGHRIRAREKHDVEMIRKVAEYKGFKKGYRQIYMMMPYVTGEQLGLHRIMTLMRRYGLNAGIREKKTSRRAMRDLVDRNIKPNLIQRDFRSHRPNEVRLIDVTYLDYGDGQRSYGSAAIDPVTGRLICFVVSEKNDLELAMATLEAMDSSSIKSGGIIHSDQGIIYFLDDYQDAVKALGMHQSMSRRGNCWDNAPQESFFGHFKDECDYKKCQTIDELRCVTTRYSAYYNEERKMWNRMKMTPVEYEEYLLGLGEEEFTQYLETEKTAYEKRCLEAAEKAVNSARDMKEKAKKELEVGSGEQV